MVKLVTNTCLEILTAVSETIFLSAWAPKAPKATETAPSNAAICRNVLCMLTNYTGKRILAKVIATKTMGRLIVERFSLV
jgi:hypothetical protein